MIVDYKSIDKLIHVFDKKTLNGYIVSVIWDKDLMKYQALER